MDFLKNDLAQNDHETHASHGLHEDYYNAKKKKEEPLLQSQQMGRICPPQHHRHGQILYRRIDPQVRKPHLGCSALSN